MPDEQTDDSLVLVYDRDVDVTTLFRLKRDLIAGGARVRIEKRVKNLKPLLERLADAGYTRFAAVTSQTGQVAQLQFRDLS